MENWIALIGVLAGVVVVFYRAYIAPILRENEMKAGYQSIAEPRPIFQRGESDDEFWAAVNRERARFAGSGNNWAKKQSPVIPIPYNREFTVEWFGKSYNLSTIGMRQHEYLIEAMRIYVEFHAIWQRETAIFGDAVNAEAMGQKPFDEKKIWR